MRYVCMITVIFTSETAKTKIVLPLAETQTDMPQRDAVYAPDVVFYIIRIST
jgi:hypothetical protein